MYDKLLHLAGCFFIAQIDPNLAYIAAISKEVIYDHAMHRGTPEVADAIAGLIGAELGKRNKKREPQFKLTLPNGEVEYVNIRTMEPIVNRD